VEVACQHVMMSGCSADVTNFPDGPYQVCAWKDPNAGSVFLEHEKHGASDDNNSDNNNNSTTTNEVVYYYFSWSGTSREREQRDEWKSVWSARSWNGFLRPGNNTEAVWEDIRSGLSTVFKQCRHASPKIELWGGQISKIPPNATAFAHRDAVYSIGIDLLITEEADDEGINDEARFVDSVWQSTIAKHLTGSYVNYPVESLTKESYPSAYWGTNLDRLSTIKTRYDPFCALNTSQGVPVIENATISRIE